MGKAQKTQAHFIASNIIMKSTKALFIVCLLMSAIMHAEATTYTFTCTGGDDTAAIQKLVNGLASDDTLQINGNAYVSTIALWYKSNVTIVINGKLESIFTSEQTNKPYAGPSGNPVFGIFGGNNIAITGSYIKNTYNEAIAAFSVSFLDIHCNIYGAGVGRFCGIYTNSCSNVTISECEISRTSCKQSTGSYSGGEGIGLYGLNGGAVANCRIHDNGSNGVYEYSGTNTCIAGNHIYSNGMSGIQFNFNAGTDSTNHFTIEKNFIYNNRADGIDLNNNSGTAYDAWALVQDNYLSNNGWEDNGAATPDGSGIATCVYLNQVQLLRNLSVGSCRTGIYFSHCSNGYAFGNIVSKTQDSLAYAAYDEYGTNVKFDCNDLYYYDTPYPRESLKAWYTNSVTFKDQYVCGGRVIYPGWPGNPPAGLTLIKTPTPYINNHRYPTSSSDDFAISFGTPTNGYTSRVVAWTNGDAHSITLPLSGTIKCINMSGQVSYIDSQNGQATIPLTNSPVMLDIQSQRNTYYVKPDGNDTADGLTRDTAWATIDNGDAKSILSPGDTVVVLPGTYAFPSTHAPKAVDLKNTGGTPLSPITYLAKKDEGPVVIDWKKISGDRYGIVLDSASVHNVIIDGFEITGCSYPLALMNGAYADTVRNCNIHDTTAGSLQYSSAIYDASNGDNTYCNNVISNVNNIGYRDTAGLWLQSVSNAVIKNNLVYNLGYSASTKHAGCVVAAGCANAQILNNTFVNGTNALRLSGGCTNTIFTNNIITNMRESGIGNWDLSSALANSYNLYFFNKADYSGSSSKGTGELNADPRFVDVSSCNYNLSRDSAAIDAGTDIGLPFNGFAPDMGAYESAFASALDVSYLSDLKSAADGSRVNITQPMVVTAGSGVFSDGTCYVEEPSRSCGIKVVFDSSAISLASGERVTFFGTMETDSNGERQVRINSVTIISAGSDLSALGMDSKIAGGKSGLSVNGLLVKTWGKVIYKDASNNYLEIASGTGIGGMRIVLSGLASPISRIPESGQFIAVTGIAGLQNDGTAIVPVIRPRNTNDITIY